jgi:hypothetical protein
MLAFPPMSIHHGHHAIHNEESYLRPNKKDLLPDVGFNSHWPPVSATSIAVARARYLRPKREWKRAAVNKAVFYSSDEEDACNEPALVVPPARCKNQAISYASLQSSVRSLKQRHNAVKDKLHTLFTLFRKIIIITGSMHILETC